MYISNPTKLDSFVLTLAPRGRWFCFAFLSGECNQIKSNLQSHTTGDVILHGPEGPELEGFQAEEEYKATYNQAHLPLVIFYTKRHSAKFWQILKAKSGYIAAPD